MLVNIYHNAIDNVSKVGWSNTAFWVPILFKTVTTLDPPQGEYLKNPRYHIQPNNLPGIYIFFNTLSPTHQFAKHKVQLYNNLMVINTCINEKGRHVVYSVIRQHWSEYLVFKVDVSLADEASKIFPNYRMRLLNGPRLVFNFWHKYIYPFALFVEFLDQQWWNLGLFFYKRNLLKTKEGLQISWFWPIYFFYQQK